MCRRAARAAAARTLLPHPPARGQPGGAGFTPRCPSYYWPGMRWLALLLVLAGAAIDLNDASGDQLAAAGFSPSQAAQILRYRSEDGPFRQIEELLAVPQITPAVLVNLRRGLALKGQTAASKTESVPAPAGSFVILEQGHSEWQNLYGAIVFAATAMVRNTDRTPHRAVLVRLELIDARGKVVASTQGWNLAAEALATDPEAKAITPIAPGASDPLRLSIDKSEISRPFQIARLSVAAVQ
jgi:hypothetical protein